MKPTDRPFLTIIGKLEALLSCRFPCSQRLLLKSHRRVVVLGLSIALLITLTPDVEFVGPSDGFISMKAVDARNGGGGGNGGADAGPDNHSEDSGRSQSHQAGLSANQKSPVVARQQRTERELPARPRTTSPIFEGVEPLTAAQEADAIIRGWIVD